ncbi:hypothetical protein CIPAW_05G206700 [Carya illinoinensis]|uniref:Uncharacterized protein n=1 Tax=Carya illinoinensis TaxID=32201 RepID=A0A8T1QLC1_CARIL|nr:hypothetical protein CIPAW_05G206700 [Carya illinoinensis]
MDYAVGQMQKWPINKPLKWRDQNCYSVCTAENEVPEETASEFEEGLCMSDRLPKPPDCNLVSPFPLGYAIRHVLPHHQ